MSQVQIHLDSVGFEPGSEVKGRADWQDGGSYEHLTVSLLWHTEGKGTEDITIVEQREFPAMAKIGSEEFQFRLPDFPWSFSGTLVSLIWSVEASLEPKGAVARVDLASAPGRREIRL